MKILFINRDHSQWVGGDAIQMQESRKALFKLGIDSTYNTDCCYGYEQFDLVHFFHLNFHWTAINAQKCIKDHVPFIISAIFYPMELETRFEQMAYLVNNAFKVIALSETEKQEMVRCLHCDPNKIVVIPNGVNKEVFYTQPVSIKDQVIGVGRLFDPLKGASLLVEACSELHLKLVWVGKADMSEYSLKVLEKLDSHYDYLTQRELARLLNQSRLFVCPSLSERQSLAVLEGASCGCPIVDSLYNRGASLLPSSLIVDPNNKEELKSAITKQWEATRNTDTVPSWDDVGQNLHDLYFSLHHL